MRDTRTVKQHGKAWDELKEEILSRPLFPGNSEKAKAERQQRRENSALEFARVYFPGYAPSGFAKFHREREKIRGIEKEPVLLMAFRGSGKPAYFSLTSPVDEIAYGRRNFMLFSSCNEEKSGRFTGRILVELMYNRRWTASRRTFREAEGRRLGWMGGGVGGCLAVSMGQDPRGFVHGLRACSGSSQTRYNCCYRWRKRNVQLSKRYNTERI
jgi:hypothetical protein